MRSLATANIGSTTKVVDISGDDNTSLRLLEMGLTPGVEVTIVGAAPLGDPVNWNYEAIAYQFDAMKPRGWLLLPEHLYFS